MDRYEEDAERYEKALVSKGWRPFEERDHRFFELIIAHKGVEKSVSRYIEFFSPKAPLIAGDISPGYSKLEDLQIKQLADQLPDTKILLIIREPVERMLSAWRMMVGRGERPAEILTDPDEFTSWTERALKMSIPTVIATRWRQYYPNLKIIFFDDIATRPAEARREVLQVLGADPDLESGGVPADFNRKAGQYPADVSDAVRAAAARLFKDELNRCAELFGGPARDWPSRYF